MSFNRSDYAQTKVIIPRADKIFQKVTVRRTTFPGILVSQTEMFAEPKFRDSFAVMLNGNVMHNVPRCHVNMGIPDFGDPGPQNYIDLETRSPNLRRYGDPPSPYICMGTPS